MKKILCLVLSLIMAFGSFGVLFASAEEDSFLDNLAQSDALNVSSAMNYFKVDFGNLPDGFDCDIDELKTLNNGEYWNEIDLIGMDLDFLYSSADPLLWNSLDVYKTDENGNYVYDETGNRILNISRGDVGIALSAINKYVKELFYSTYGGLKLYNVKNAVSLANLIGNIFYRDFAELDVKNFTNLFGNEQPNAKEFFEAVTTLSKLDVLIQANWCSKGKDYCESIVNIISGKNIDIFTTDYNDGKILGAKMLEGLFSQINFSGPIKTLLGIFRILIISYDKVYREPIMALFTHKLEKVQSVIPADEFNTFSGLIKLACCNCDPYADEDKDRGCFASKAENRIVDHFCPLELPTDRLAVSADDDEMLIFIYYYFNLCGKHRGNAAYINSVKANIDNLPEFSSKDKERIKSIFDCYFLNRIDFTAEKLITPYLQESITVSTDGGGIFDRLKNSLMVFLKKIADYFDYLRKIFTGELDYGQGNSPFI